MCSIRVLQLAAAFSAVLLCDAASCPQSILQIDSSGLAAVADRVRSGAYWFGEDPFDGGPQAELVLLSSDTHVGFCSAPLDKCVLFSTLRETPSLVELESGIFQDTRASGIWSLPRLRRAQTKAGTVARGDTLIGGGATIVDPVGSDGTIGAAGSVDFRMASCTIGKRDFGPLIPAAVAKHVRPKNVAGLLDAIRAQGLVVGGGRVTVPFFGDNDDIVFISVYRQDIKNGLLLAVIKKGGAWWSFSPAREVNPKVPIATLRLRIDSGAMVQLTLSGERWSPSAKR